MKNKQQTWLPFLLGITMSLGIFLGFMMRDKFPNSGFFATKKPNTLDEVLYLIDQKYVDDVDASSITDTVIQSVVGKLDPHSEYMSLQDLEELNEQLDGRFSGIGIEFDMFHDTLHVTYVIPDGPASKAGLMSGDQILRVDDKSVSGNLTSSETIKSYIKGTEGSVVKVQLLRNHISKNAAITRGNIELSSVDAAYMIDKNIGYIKLNKFANNTYKEFMTALMDLKQSHMQQLILDLRDNGGGVLDQAIEIADEFLPDDKLITYTEGRHSPRKNYTCKRQGQYETGALIVLCNEGTASASEVLMGALQDWDRATIIGQRSFGKGLVQEIFELRDKSALKLTIARYYTPTGRCIQRSYANGEEAYYNEVSERRKNHYNLASDSTINDHGKIFVTPKGKKLFGGGGIAPDIAMSADDSALTEQRFAIYTGNLLTPYTIKLRNEQSQNFKRYTNIYLFNQQFNIDEKLWSDFSSFSKKEGLSMDSISSSEKQTLSKTIKAYIGKQIWGKQGFFQVLNAADPEIRKACDVLAH